MSSDQRQITAPLNFMHHISVDGNRIVDENARPNAHFANRPAILERPNELQICASHSQQVYNASRDQAHKSRGELTRKHRSSMTRELEKQDIRLAERVKVSKKNRV